MDVGHWLCTFGLSQYETAFREREIDDGILSELTDRHLQELGVSLGHRLQMLRSIREFAKSAAIKSSRAAPPEPKPSAVHIVYPDTILTAFIYVSTREAARRRSEAFTF